MAIRRALHEHIRNYTLFWNGRYQVVSAPQSTQETVWPKGRLHAPALHLQHLRRHKHLQKPQRHRDAFKIQRASRRLSNWLPMPRTERLLHRPLLRKPASSVPMVCPALRSSPMHLRGSWIQSGLYARHFLIQHRARAHGLGRQSPELCRHISLPAYHRSSTSSRTSQQRITRIWTKK